MRLIYFYSYLRCRNIPFFTKIVAREMSNLCALECGQENLIANKGVMGKQVSGGNPAHATLVRTAAPRRASVVRLQVSNTIWRGALESHLLRALTRYTVVRPLKWTRRPERSRTRQTLNVPRRCRSWGWLAPSASRPSITTSRC